MSTANDPTTDSALGQTYLIHSYEHRAYPLLYDRSFTIGRDVGCDIMVNEVFVSRHHAELRPDGGRNYTLSPVGSTPTLLNDVAIDAPVTLQEGDAFMVGTMKFVFTQNRLPVAVAVAAPGAHVLSGVDDKRQTLTFPLQSGPQQPERPVGIWIALGVVILVVAALLYRIL